MNYKPGLWHNLGANEYIYIIKKINNDYLHFYSYLNGYNKWNGPFLDNLGILELFPQKISLLNNESKINLIKSIFEKL